MIRILILAAVSLAAVSTATARTEASSRPGRRCAISTPAPGSTDRRQMMEALRPAIQRQTGMPTEFVVRRLDVACGWARALVDPRSRDRLNRYEPVEALFQRSARGWVLRDTDFGCGDDERCAGPSARWRRMGAPVEILAR